MALACLCALQTMPGHASDQLADGALGDLPSDLHRGISELLDSLWPYLAASDAPIFFLAQNAKGACSMLNSVKDSQH